jgi:hypothetical protein
VVVAEIERRITRSAPGAFDSELTAEAAQIKARGLQHDVKCDNLEVTARVEAAAKEAQAPRQSQSVLAEDKRRMEAKGKGSLLHES